MKLENPFKGLAYMTEKKVMPEKVLERYSIFPLKYLLQYLNEPINSFFVGRTGVGKTMILSLFDLPYQKELYSNAIENDAINNRKNIVELLPKEVIGIYSNIDSPYIRFTRFQGRMLQDNKSWMRVFGDYYGHVLVRNLISTIEELSKLQKWRDHNNVNEMNNTILDSISIAYSSKISNELHDSKGISNWDDLKKYIDKRISDWIGAVNILGDEDFSGPSETVQLITPCLYLIEELKNKKVLGEDCRLFIIVDQYETLFEHRNNIDFRPIFNLAMRQAARGGTRIEFKMGVRPYGYRDNLEIFDSSIKLDLMKECNEIFIDDLTEKYYDDFIEDLTLRCLKKYKIYENIKKAKEIFESLTPVEEVKKYVGESTILNKHFSLFFKKNSKRNEIIATIEDISRNIIRSEYKVWIETLLSIYSERYINKNKYMDNTSFKLMLNDRYTVLQSIIADECGTPYEGYISDTISKDLRTKEYDSYKDIRSGALFIIATSYKNKPKIYSGYDTIVMASSRIVLHYIQIVSEAFNFYLLENEEEAKPIPAIMQSNALYGRANRVFDSIPNTVPRGVAVSNFLRNLGLLFRWLQLDPTLNKPYPNGFSVLNDLINQFDSKSVDPDIKMKADIINEVLSYGFLEKAEHKDKNSRYKYKRYKYYLNRVLCPYFGIPVPHRKDPFYIDEEYEFLNCLFQKDCDINKLKKYLTLGTYKNEVNSENLAHFLND